MATTTEETTETPGLPQPMVDIGTLITRTPGVRGGDPCLAGTRITVRNIVIWHEMGWSPEEIVRRYPHLTLSKVYAGLTYYFANKDKLDAQFAAEEAEELRIEREFLEKRGLPLDEVR